MRYNSFNNYLRSKFGERVHRISIDAGFRCPNLDGTLSRQGCIFCNNKAFSRFTNCPPLPIEEQIEKSIKYYSKRFKAKKFIAYFQSFSNTYAEADFLEKQYSVIRKFKDIVGLSISTRPDCIDDKKLDVIESFSKDYSVFIEYGLQTIHDKSLKLINRNHTFKDFEKAVKLTSARKNIDIGVHIVLGLPGETKEDMLDSARVLSKMPLWGVKFHCLHVVKGTALEDIYEEKKIKLLSEDEYVDILINFLEIIPKDWVVLRLVSDADWDLLIKPLWVNDKHRILKKIEEEFEKRGVCQGDLHESISCKSK